MQHQHQDRAAGNAPDSFVGLTALVVEDEGGIALLLEDMLIDLGFTIGRSVAHLREAIEVTQSQTFDIAILDVNLGGEASFPVARILSERQTPIIFSSGYGGAVMPAEFAAYPVLGKPFTMEQLTIAITALLEGAGRTRSDASS